MSAVAVNTNLSRVFLLTNNVDCQVMIKNVLASDSFETLFSEGEKDDILVQIHHFMPDIILIDTEYENTEFVIRQVKSASKNQDSQIILILNKEIPFEILNMAQGVIETPVKPEILLSVINSHVKIKKSLDRLYENNKELSRSLYQLNVLYNTSSQFAGTLNTDKLYEVMIEAMEKTLSFDISSVILFNTEKKPVFKLNTIHIPSENLIDALKIRSILNFRSVFEHETQFEKNLFEKMETENKIKQERSSRVFGIDCISYDSLFAPIKVGDEIFGVVELFRQNPFLQEDVTCFQAIAHQVALPLRSAKLYEEISITNKKLEKLERIKSDFISIVSHELRTPLTPIDNALEIVLSGEAGEVSEGAKNFISMAKRNIQRLKGIIKDLLDLSKIEAGKLDFEYQITSITPSLELLKNTFAQDASRKNIEISLEIDEKLPEIYVDTRRIEQIFTNLVSNSLKFTSDNGKITVRAGVVSQNDIDINKTVSPVMKPEGDYIKISVQDNGIGMKKEDIPKIFDKFSQIESSLNRNNGGVGLGLSITKQLIDSHLGLISVESEEKKGSTFSVFLPLEDDKKIFLMNLMRDVTNSKDLGLIKISYDRNSEIINELKEMKLITEHTLREMFVEKEDIKDYYFYIPDISIESFNALFNSIEAYCSKVQKGKITLLKLHSYTDSDIVKNIINNL